MTPRWSSIKPSIMVSSDSLETGTGSSNSLRSANESLRTDNELFLIVTLVGARQLATIDRYRDAHELEQLLRRVSQSASEHLEVLAMLPIGNVRKEARDLEFLDRY